MFRLWISVLMFALPITGTMAQASPAPTNAGSIIFTDAVLIDGTGAGPRPGMTIEIDAGRIVAIYPGGTQSPPAGAELFDLAGRTLMPGLINAHVHLQSSDDAEGGLIDMLRRGITSVRDLGGDIRPLRALRNRAEAGEIHIPAIYYSAVLAGPAHMADPRMAASSQGYDLGEAPWARSVTADSDLVAIVDEARATGAHGLKIYASIDGVLLARIIEEADRQGMSTWVHSVLFPAPADAVVAARPTQLIHAKGMVSANAENLPATFREGIQRFMTSRPFAELDPEMPPYSQLFAEMHRSNVMLEPVLVADGDMTMDRQPLSPPVAAMRDWACTATGAAFRAGVEIGAGTDFDGGGDMLMRELRRLEACGLPREAVLRAATLVNARAIGVEEETGSIEIGKRADMIVLAGDPLTDLETLAVPAMVVQSGRFVEPLAATGN